MSVYSFDDIALAVTPPELEARAGLKQLCTSLAWQPERGGLRNPPRTSIALRLHGHGATVPNGATPRYQTDGFRIFEDDACSYVSDGASTLQVRAGRSQADAFLDESFHQKSRLLQWQFWSFCILKLLRPSGYFSLHAAAVVSPHGTGLLIVGPSGSGKSTLAVGLIRAGWGYLTDDAVLVCRRGPAMCAVPFRRQFYVDASSSASYADLRLGHAVPDGTGGARCELHIDDSHAHRRLSESVPRLLLFPTIVDADDSAAVPLDAVSAVGHLLSASGPQLFDRTYMDGHMEAIRSVVQQCAAYRLQAGRDLHHRPDRVLQLIPGGGEL